MSCKFIRNRKYIMESKKSKLKSLILNIDKYYISKKDIKEKMLEEKINLTNETLNSYIKEFKNSKFIFSAGRGWYTKIEMKGVLSYKPTHNIVKKLEGKFPFLEFNCWSTEQFQPFFHHLLGKHLTFVYTSRDAISTLADFLRDRGYSVLENPSKLNYRDSLQKLNIQIVIRPSIEREPNNNSHYSPIEKAAIDFIIENNVGNICSVEELDNCIKSALRSFYTDITGLEYYASQKQIEVNKLI